MTIDYVFELINHMFKKLTRSCLEISFHLVKLGKWQNQSLCLLL